MTARFSLCPTDPPLVHCALSGFLTEGAILGAIARGYDLGLIVPGRGRIVRAEPGTAFHELDLAALERIRDAELAFETRGGRTPGHLSTLVAPTLGLRTVAEFYGSVWDALRLPGVRYLVVETVEEACAAHGVDPAAFRVPQHHGA